jgi:hypothetical protein
MAQGRIFTSIAMTHALHSFPVRRAHPRTLSEHVSGIRAISAPADSSVGLCLFRYHIVRCVLVIFGECFSFVLTLQAFCHHKLGSVSASLGRRRRRIFPLALPQTGTALQFLLCKTFTDYTYIVAFWFIITIITTFTIIICYR